MCMLRSLAMKKAYQNFIVFVRSSYKEKVENQNTVSK